MKFVGGSRLGFAAAVLAFAALASTTVSAQDAPEQHKEAVALGAAPDEDHTLFNLSLGFTGNSGNTQSISGNGGFGLMTKRDRHVFTLDALATLGWANQTPSSGGKLQDSARNIVGRARYDYFLSDLDALFVAFAPRRDVFAGIAARLQFQAGYARVLYQPEEGRRIWGELGGDVTVDRYEALEQEDGTFANPTDTEIYSVRLFLGYENLVGESVQVRLGLEALLPPYDKKGEPDQEFNRNGVYRYRLNGNAEVLAALNSSLKIGGSFRVLYDSSPAAGVPYKLDTITTFLVSYTYDSHAEKPAEPEEPTCPPCEGAASPEAEATAGEAAAAAANEPAAAAPAGSVAEPTPEEVAAAEKLAAEKAAAVEEAPVAEQAAAAEESAAEEAAAEATAPAEEAVEEGAAAAPKPGTTDAPVQPPAAGGE